MLRIEQVSVAYGATLAVDRVSLSVAPAERVAVLGPSGSGKSTLLRAVAGLEPLTAGSIALDGRDLARVPVHRRGVGLMFQDYVLFPQRDVRGNVAFGLEMRGDGRATAARRVDEVLELVGLPGYGPRRITELSGGEQQRVALARALAPTPRLLMLDEPLGALDRALRSALLDELAALFTGLDLPILYVTHDQEEALAIAHRVAVMRAGRLETVLPPLELWHSPPSEFVARFLGFTNISEYVREGSAARTPWGLVPLPDAAPDSGVLLVRADGLTPDPEGPLAGIVRSATFRGDHTRVVVVAAEGGGDPLQADLRAGTPTVGEALRLRVEPDAVVILAPGTGSD
jgi:thiamine transport system ATP-binding protein